MPLVAHGEAPRHLLVHRQVFALEVGERELIVAAGRREEPAVAFGAPFVPVVPGILETTTAPWMRATRERAPRGLHRLAVGAGKLLERVRVDRELLSVARPALLEIVRVA